jgi:oligoribonuclease
MVATGPSLVIHQSDEALARMNSYVAQLHQQSGLVNEVRQSTISMHHAEHAVLAFVQQHCTKKTALLCGNTIWQDRSFLRKYMPQLEDYFHYRMIDVSTIKELVRRWYPQNSLTIFQKNDVHRAQTDIYESIAELAHYRTNFFI